MILLNSLWKILLGLIMEIGQVVKVCRLRDRVSEEVAQRLGQVGKIKEY